MFARLEKVIPEERQKRFYVKRVRKTRFGEWRRIGSVEGQRQVDDIEAAEEALVALHKLSENKCRRCHHQR